MDEETIRLDSREQARALVLTRLVEGRLTVGQAAALLGLSERQVQRLQAAYRADGTKALVHGNRGRVPWQAVPSAVRARVVELARGRYAGLNQQHFTEKLAEVEQLPLSRPTVRRVLLAAGLPSPRTRRAPQHRSRRERWPQEGMLLQADGSPHRWLGPDRPPLTLIGAIDDATGAVPWALFRAQEDAHGYLALLQQIVCTRGIPLALYVDRHGIFTKSSRDPLTLEEQLTGRRLPTQVGRALQELAIQPIYALSPQAKGRIERLWGTWQDRFVSELRLAGATTLEEANQVLWAWLPTFNARFSVPAAQPGSAYRVPPPDFVPERVFCFKYPRTVRPDNTVSFAGRQLQVLPSALRASYARLRVEVQERLDGSLAVLADDTVLTTTPAPADAPTLRARPLARPSGGPAPERRAALTPLSREELRRSRPPAAVHPWRR